MGPPGGLSAECRLQVTFALKVREALHLCQYSAMLRYVISK